MSASIHRASVRCPTVVEAVRQSPIIAFDRTLPADWAALLQERRSKVKTNYSCEFRRRFRIADTPARPARPALSSAIVAGSGTAFRPGAVICPLPEVAKVPIKSGAGLPEDAMSMPVAVAKPVAPLKIPVPPRIVKVLENVVGPNSTKSVPVNVSAPPLNEAVKLFDTEDGTNWPEGNIAKLITPASE